MREKAEESYEAAALFPIKTICSKDAGNKLLSIHFPTAPISTSAGFNILTTPLGGKAIAKPFNYP